MVFERHECLPARHRLLTGRTSRSLLMVDSLRLEASKKAFNRVRRKLDVEQTSTHSNQYRSSARAQVFNYNAAWTFHDYSLA